MYLLFKTIIFLLIIGNLVHLQAQEQGGSAPKAESKPEAKPEEGGAQSAVEEVPEWVEIQNKMSMLSAKINASQGSLRKLMEEKKDLPENSPKVKEIANEIVKQHKDLKKLADEYDQQTAILKYRYPERAMKSGTQGRLHVDSIEEMETDLSLDGRLDRNLKKVRSQFGTKPRKKASKKQEKPIEESESIILRK